MKRANLSVTAAASPLSGETGEDTALALQGSVQQLGEYILRMGQLIGQMQRRMDELEARQKQVTVSHRDALRLQAMIRARGEEYCQRYNLNSPDSLRVIRAAIKRDIRQRYGVKDLHDLPAGMLRAVEDEIIRWANIRLVLDCRERLEGGA